ncbi:type II toxin-antitoxin system VapC family toxin [Candidatus Daviesbacteria bacterium]|nr:type II toxin-antitoxin system VapC family toxin [Candidatus Daviesbacteria bacterium]
MAKKIVVDSSVIVKWLNATDEKDLEKADKLLADALEGKIELLAPELAKYEVGNVLLLGKKLSPPDLRIPLHTLFVSPVEFISESEELAKETYFLAFDLGITYYDASFLSLAKAYNAALVTDNIKHQGKASSIKVISLKDY